MSKFLKQYVETPGGLVRRDVWERLNEGDDAKSVRAKRELAQKKRTFRAALNSPDAGRIVGPKTKL